MKLNCWEFQQCGRQHGGSKVDELGVCPAASKEKANGINHGKNGGRACWALAGTFCNGTIQATFAKKFADCIHCSFYQRVLEEEGKDFVPSLEIHECISENGGIVISKQNEKLAGGKQIKVITLAALFILLLFPFRELYADALNECLMEALKYADDTVTVGQLREQCRDENGIISKDKPDNSPAVTIDSNGPAEEMVLKTVQARKPAFFPHKIHQDRYPCGTCHHGKDLGGRLVKYDEQTVISKCTSCHNSDMPNEKLNGFQLIGHQLCRECHRTHQDMTSAKCSTCHRPNL